MDTLKVHRVRAGLTQAELAEKIGTDPATISDYENARSLPSGPRLQALARALNCSADDIELPDRAVA